MADPTDHEPRPPRGRPRSSATDDAILRAALKVMGEEGYARLSIEAVAAEAGVSRPTIYRRYPGGKSELAPAALADLRSKGDIPHTGDLRTDLVAELGRFRDGVERPFGMAMIGTVLAEAQHAPELLERFREHVVAPRRRLLRTVLEEGLQRGDVRAGLDLDLAVAMLVGAYYAGHLAGDHLGPDWPERCVDLLLPSLRAG